MARRHSTPPPPSPEGNEVSTSLRLPAALLERIDALAAAYGKSTGLSDVSRSQVLRNAITAGVEVLEHKIGKRADR